MFRKRLPGLSPEDETAFSRDLNRLLQDTNEVCPVVENQLPGIYGDKPYDQAAKDRDISAARNISELEATETTQRQPAQETSSFKKYLGALGTRWLWIISGYKKGDNEGENNEQ